MGGRADARPALDPRALRRASGRSTASASRRACTSRRRRRTSCATLTAGGAQVALCAANPLSTQDDVAAALVADDGVEVHAAPRRGPRRLRRPRRRAARRARRRSRSTTAPTCSRRCTPRARTCCDGMLGGTEETTTGLVRLRALEAEGRLALPGPRRQRGAHRARVQRPLRHRPVDARRHPARDQPAARRRAPSSCSATAGPAAASRCAPAAPARRSIVCEVDPIARARGADGGLRGDAGARGRRARRRLHHRHRRAAPSCGREHFERMKDGAVLANAGHFDVEIDLDALRELGGDGARRAPARRASTTSPTGAASTCWPRGRVVNLAAGRGPSGRGHGPVLRDAGAGGRAPRAAATATLGPRRARRCPTTSTARSRGSSSPRSASRSTS